MVVSAYAEPMAETYASPRFGQPREPKNRVDPGSRLVSALDLVTGSHVRAIAFLTLCALLLFLPGFFNIPPIDRDEARFAQATKQMVETGDFVDIRFQDDVRYKKPVGIYWLQATTVETAAKLGLQRAQVRIWLYRIPSLIGAIGAVLLTYWTALAFVTRRGAILAGLILCSSMLLGVEARLAKTDAMLLLTVVAAMGAGWRHPAQGTADPDVRRADGCHAGDPRSLRNMAVASASGMGPDVDACSCAAVVWRDLLARRRYIFRRL